ncbi:TIGR00366 family protein [Mesorhizobium sp. BR1-1-16]|uniref:TIGR00366 family protein n=1 Tax=Mesorhizobium sp. BR1-1-16 TaxID=2876653 RepID=UPI001CCC6A1A|nr:TIGR00366 family protein [Mesorhizobium sp. BR1-1-16]
MQDLRSGRGGGLEALSNRVVDLADRWFPDAYVFVLAAVVLVAIAAVAHGVSPMQVGIAFGDGFWSLGPFTLQMTYVAIGGYVVATSPPAAALLRRIAGLPASGRSAVVWIALVSIGLSLVNWGLSLIFSGLLVREVARRTDIALDYRAAGAAAYLGLGCGFTLGISSSAAQMQANSDSIPASLLPITGVIDFSQTIFTWQNGLMIAVITAVAAAVCYWTVPGPGNVRTASDLGVDLSIAEPEAVQGRRPADWLADSPILTILFVALCLCWIANRFVAGSPIQHLSGLDTYNFIFLLMGILLHWRPKNLTNAFARAVPTVSGVLLQFPFYAGIAAMLTVPRNAAGQTLSDAIATFFIGASSGPTIFSGVVGLYSAFLGLFIPSAGGKWVIEAPYVMTAAKAVGAHPGWTVMVYNIAETLPNFINPFWMLPLLGILGLRAKDLVGFTAMQFIVHLPIALILGAILMSTFN